MVAVQQQRAGRLGLGVNEEREHEHLGVPERVPPVTLTRQRVGPDVDAQIGLVRRDQQLVDVETHGAGRVGVSVDRDVGIGPFCLPCRAVPLPAPLKSGRGVAAELVQACRADGGRRDITGGIDGDELVHGERVAGGHLRVCHLLDVFVPLLDAGLGGRRYPGQCRVPDGDAGVDGTGFQVDAVGEVLPGYLVQVPGSGPLVPLHLRIVRRRLGVDRPPVQVVSRAVDATADNYRRRVILRRDPGPQAAQMLGGTAGEMNGLDPGPAALRILEHGVAEHRALPHVQYPPVADH